MNREEKEVFRGHAEECLKALSSNLAKSDHKEVKRVINHMAAFCGVRAKTIREWLKKTEKLPQGEYYLRAVCFLDLMGYRVIELERKQKGPRGFFELLGFGIITVEEAIRRLGYSSRTVFFRALIYRNNQSEEKNQKMWEIWKERRNELKKIKEELRNQDYLGTPQAMKTAAEKGRSFEPCQKGASGSASIFIIRR